MGKSFTALQCRNLPFLVCPLWYNMGAIGGEVRDA